MAIITNESASHPKMTPMTPPTPEKKKRRRRRGRGKRHNNSSSNDELSDSASASSSSSSPQQSRRKRKIAKKKEPELTAEEQEQYVAMDCEMVGVGRNGNKSVLARVTIVNWNYEILLDKFIRPSEPVTDYRSFVSGITQADLESEDAVDIDTCRQAVSELLEGRILVGHALKNDLAALGIRHPWQMTRDTAKYEPFMKVRFDDGIFWPRKLKELCNEKLSLEIQQPGKPHSAFEDAGAALKLYKSVRTKWEKVMSYKILRTAEIEQQKLTEQEKTGEDQ